MTEVLSNLEKVEGSPFVNLKEYEDNPEDTAPEMDDPAWSDYVIRQLLQDEMYDGNPTTDGLRRVVNKLLGDIIESTPIIAQCPNPQNDNHATIGWRLVIRWGGNPTDLRVFGDVADVYIGNTVKDYAVYATATAATKAEGRALRKALQLRHVIASEEIGGLPAEDPTKINSGQITFIDMMCQRNNINVLKLLAQSKLKKFERIEDVPYATAVQISKYLSDCQNGIAKTPDQIKGYDENWRKA